MKYTLTLICVMLILSFKISAQQNEPTFEQYKTAVQQFKLAQPDYKSDAQAKQYRKYLNNSVKSGVNFAGQYVLTNWSCGKQCVRYAIIDAKSGKVFFPEMLQNVSAQVNSADANQKQAQYLPDSRLLILNSADGAGKKVFYEWTGSELKEIKLMPAADLKPVNADSSPVVLTEFKPVVSQIESKTRVPVLLPSIIPPPKFLPRVVPVQEGSTALVLYSFVKTINDSEYDLTIDITSDCDGRPNCNYGHAAGSKNSSAAPTKMTNVEYNAQKAEKVSLAHGLTGFYVPAPENPRALAGAQIFWLDGAGNQYMVSLKRAPKEDVVAMANSMIDNFPINK